MAELSKDDVKRICDEFYGTNYSSDAFKRSPEIARTRFELVPETVLREMRDMVASGILRPSALTHVGIHDMLTTLAVYRHQAIAAEADVAEALAQAQQSAEAAEGAVVERDAMREALSGLMTATNRAMKGRGEVDHAVAVALLRAHEALVHPDDEDDLANEVTT